MNENTLENFTPVHPEFLITAAYFGEHCGLPKHGYTTHVVSGPGFTSKEDLTELSGVIFTQVLKEKKLKDLEVTVIGIQKLPIL